MRVILFQSRFADKILSGLKTSTIRKTARCKPGDTLSLRCWQGLPRRSKQDVLLQVPCLSVLPIVLDFDELFSIEVNGIFQDHFDRREIWQHEGFDGEDNMRDWFLENHGLPFSGWMITWR